MRSRLLLSPLRRLPDRAGFELSFDEATDRVRQNGRTSRQLFALVNAATCFDRFLAFAVSLHSYYRPLR